MKAQKAAWLIEGDGNLFIIIILLTWALSTLAGSLGVAAKRRITVVSLTASLTPSLHYFS